MPANPTPTENVTVTPTLKRSSRRPRRGCRGGHCSCPFSSDHSLENQRGDNVKKQDDDQQDECRAQ